MAVFAGTATDTLSIRSAIDKVGLFISFCAPAATAAVATTRDSPSTSTLPLLLRPHPSAQRSEGSIDPPCPRRVVRRHGREVFGVLRPGAVVLNWVHG